MSTDRQMTGEPRHVCSRFLVVTFSSTSTSETVAAHRASSLLEILPVALQTGYSEVVPALEPLKVQ
jgi:hypothetical protein